MADNISLKTWTGEINTPLHDAIVRDTLTQTSGVYKGCTVTYTSGNILHMAAGYGMIKGRLFEIYDNDIAVELPAAGTYVGRIYVRIDLSNTDEPIQLVAFTGNNLPDLTQDDNINFNNGIWEMELCTFSATPTAISDIVFTAPTVSGRFDTIETEIAQVNADLTELKKHAGGSTFTIEATETSLNGKTVTITKDGVTVASGTMTNNQCILSVTEIGRLTITCGSYSVSRTVKYYSNYTIKMGVIHYGFKIEKANSNPSTRVIYIEDNEDFESAYMNYSQDKFEYGDWEDAFFMPRPCMLKSNGKVDYFLDPNNYALKEDGSSSDIANTSYNGNAMMQFPKIWQYIYEDDDYIYVHIANKQVNSNYTDYSNIDCNGKQIDYFYTPIYNGSNISSKLRSLSGQTVLTSQSGTTEITYATANNINSATEWYIEQWCDRSLLMNLCYLIGKSTDLQSTFGNGCSTSAKGTTGTMNTKGLFWGDTNTNVGVKVFGMEHLWANYWRRTAGLMSSGTTIYAKSTWSTADGTTVTGYQTTAVTGMTAVGVISGGSSGGYISQATGTKHGIIPISTASGSSSTYYCDGLWWGANPGYAFVGGDYYSSARGGAAVYLNDAVSFGNGNVGACLSCKPLAA